MRACGLSLTGSVQPSRKVREMLLYGVGLCKFPFTHEIEACVQRQMPEPAHTLLLR